MNVYVDIVCIKYHIYFIVSVEVYAVYSTWFGLFYTHDSKVFQVKSTLFQIRPAATISSFNLSRG